MNVAQIKNRLRDAADDEIGGDNDRFWKSDNLLDYINQVVRKIAEETRCIRDARTVSVCVIDVDVVDYTTLASDTMDYLFANDTGSIAYQQDLAPYSLTLHDSIIAVDKAKWLSQATILSKGSSVAWSIDPQWEQRPGVPTLFALDHSAGTIALNYRAQQNDKLILSVRRLPLVDLVDDDDVPEIRLDYHDAITYGVLELMYSKQDAESFDKKKIAQFTSKFEDEIDRIKRMEELLDQRLKPTEPRMAFR